MTIDETPSISYPEWKLYVDGASGAKGFGAGVILIGRYRIRIKYAFRIKYDATNNASEYEALLIGLRLALEVRAENLKIHSDSQLVVNQVKGTYQVKEPSIIKFVDKAKQLIKKLEQDGG